MSRARPLPLGAESVAVQAVKAVVYLAAGALLLAPLATPVGLASAGASGLLSFALAGWAVRRRLRLPVALLFGALSFALGTAGASLVREDPALAAGLGVEGTVWASEALTFGLGLLGALFTVRFLAQKSRLVSVLEAGVIVFSVVYTFADHRDCHLNQPREFADRVLETGVGDPAPMLLAMGAGIMLLAVLMFMRRQSAGKTALSMVVAVAVGVGVYLFIEDDHICGGLAATQPWAQSGDGEHEAKPDDEDGGQDGDKDKDKDKDKDGKGGGQGDPKEGPQGGGGGGGQGKSPYGKPPPQAPQPVAVVAFHDDYESKEGILYFRQQVQSRFDHTHLSVDDSGRFDRDVLTTYPTQAPLEAGPGINPDLHVTVPTSVFLLADHPQPISLAQAQTLRPLDNPNPRLFVAAYDVTSYVLSVDPARLVGRKSIPADWDEATRRHYTELPDDPRYASLSDEILRDLDLRFQDDDLMRALLIKRWLEKHGYYTLKETHADETDPTASFLFGSLRGYCVHFANAAVFLLRSQGIAARVAVGYGVDTRKRSGGSNLLILGNMAHAWPEIHLEGVGWVTFDVYPEESDEPPQQIIDQDLESMLGEIARKDPTGGRGADPDAAPFPFGLVLLIAACCVAAFILGLYAIKATRRLAVGLVRGRSIHRWAMRASLDVLADVGVVRQRGETREDFAARVSALAPSLAALTFAHLRAALGRPGATDADAEVRALYRRVRSELRAALPLHRRLVGALNPVGWWLVR